MDKRKLAGQCMNGSLCLPIENIDVNLLDAQGKIVAKTRTDRKGRWKLETEINSGKISFAGEGYIPKIADIVNVAKVTRLLENDLIGYSDKLWYQPGETVHFFVHSPVKFSASLMRYGEARVIIKKIGTFAAMTQQIPDGFFVESGPNWQETFHFTIPREIEPGLFGVFLQSEEGDHSSYQASFIISTSPKKYGKKSKLLVLASTTTWQTYNVWGGRSRYRNFENPNKSVLKNWIHLLLIKFLPENLKQRLKKILKSQIVLSIKTNPDAWQFKKLSVRRPHPNLSIYEENPETEFTSHLSAGEWRVLAWLEREKFSYDIVSGFDFHNDTELLHHYDAVLLNTHCEYWSKEMFAGLMKFHKNGGAILNISGNSIFREIEFYPEGHLRCVSLSFNYSAADESQILGVRFDMRGYQTKAPYQVIQPTHWVFADTKLKQGDSFAIKSLNQPDANDSENDSYDATKPGIRVEKVSHGDGGSGWETDKITATAPKDVILLAKGKNPGKGGADMIIREPKDGAGLVFSVSSIAFGGSLLVDEASSQIVKNVLNRVLKIQKK